MFLNTLYFCLSSIDDLNYSYYFNETNNFNIKIKPKVLLNKLGFNYDFPDKVIPTLGEVVEISKPSIYLYNTAYHNHTCSRLSHEGYSLLSLSPIPTLLTLNEL